MQAYRVATTCTCNFRKDSHIYDPTENYLYCQISSNPVINVQPIYDLHPDLEYCADTDLWMVEANDLHDGNCGCELVKRILLFSGVM